MPEPPLHIDRHVADLADAIERHEAGTLTLDLLCRRMVAFGLLFAGDETRELIAAIVAHPPRGPRVLPGGSTPTAVASSHAKKRESVRPAATDSTT